jgi:hypothetical protein
MTKQYTFDRPVLYCGIKYKKGDIIKAGKEMEPSAIAHYLRQGVLVETAAGLKKKKTEPAEEKTIETP